MAQLRPKLTGLIPSPGFYYYFIYLIIPTISNDFLLTNYSKQNGCHFHGIDKRVKTCAEQVYNNQFSLRAVRYYLYLTCLTSTWKYLPI